MKYAVLSADLSFSHWIDVADGSIVRPDRTRPVLETSLPTFDPNTEKVVGGIPTITETHAIENWLVQPLTAAELQAIADGVDLAKVKALMQDIKNGVGTNLERIARLERAVFRLGKYLFT